MLETLVPGGDPVALVDYDRELAAAYPTCGMQTRRWFVENVADDWTILDVGADIGLYAILLSRLASKGRVIAFEPTAAALKLIRNLEAAGAGRVAFEPLALARAAGRREEAIFRKRNDTPERDVFPFDTLDLYVERKAIARVDCVRIDMRGLDFETLQGARRTLERMNPYVVVALGPALARRGQSVAEALAWLDDLGYREALVLDHEIFVLKRGADAGGAGMTLHFDRRPVADDAATTRGAALAGGLAGPPVAVNGAALETHGDGWSVSGRMPAWAFAAVLPLDAAFLAGAGPAVIGLDVEAQTGRIGVGLVTDDAAAFVGEVRELAAGGGPRQIDLPFAPGATKLAIRCSDPDGGALSLRVLAARAHAAVAGAASAPAYMAVDAREIAIDELARALGRAGDSA